MSHADTFPQLSVGERAIERSSGRDVSRRSQLMDSLSSHFEGWGQETQHPYQNAIFCVRAEREASRRLAATFSAGCLRLTLHVPAAARLLKWELGHAVSDWASRQRRMPGRARRAVRTLSLLLGLLGATVACGLVSRGGSDGDGKDRALSVDPLAPNLSKPKLVSPPRTRRGAPWTYVLPVDHGVRADKSGQGHFRAPRFHGEHNGLDLLAPVGTPVFSPCEGKAMTGASRSFGRWIHVICPVPDEYMKKGEPRPWASFFYAHLHETDLPFNEWVDVEGAQAIGQVGKSGNARGPNIQPHLHLELIVQRNQRAAMDERHLGKDQSNVAAADYFAQGLSSRCMAPFGFQAKSQMLSRARRLDPFIALTCLSEFKPNFIKAPSPLTDSSRDWTQYYVAKDFNVNLGVEDSVLASR